MPELAEVDYYRKQWNAGMGRKIIAVLLHDGKRVFRGVDTKVLKKVLAGATLLSSESRGKQMLFRFSRQGWIGLIWACRVNCGRFQAALNHFLPASTIIWC